MVDRIDLNAQISATFHASDIPSLVKAGTRKELQQLLEQDTHKIVITTIHRFGEADGVLIERGNIIAMVYDAHRTQEGGLVMKMRAAILNALLFGLTGTPINKCDRNTFYAFGVEEDKQGYMSRYGFEESIRDGATLKLHFEPRMVSMHIDKEAIEEAYAELTGGLSDFDKDKLGRKASKMEVLVRIQNCGQFYLTTTIATLYQDKVEPNRFKGMVGFTTFPRTPS